VSACVLRCGQYRLVSHRVGLAAGMLLPLTLIFIWLVVMPSNACGAQFSAWRPR
jgi:hypothetical protein